MILNCVTIMKPIIKPLILHSVSPNSIVTYPYHWPTRTLTDR